jgi:hypothetical protein
MLAGDTIPASIAGFLSVALKGGETASVFIDGVLRGKTTGKGPLILRTAAGKHVITVKGLSKVLAPISVVVAAHDTVRALLTPGANATKP